MNYPITKTERYSMARPSFDLIAEPLQNCLETIVSKAVKDAAQIIMVSAAHRSSGVTTICVNLTTYLAEGYGTTLLADGEALVQLSLRGLLPRWSMYRRVEPGCVWVLGNAEIAQAIESEDGASTSLDAVMIALKGQFDYVVIDAPAINHNSTAETLASAVDGNVFVGIPYTTERHEASLAAKRLTESGGRLLGSIYNSAYQTFGPGA